MTKRRQLALMALLAAGAVVLAWLMLSASDTTTGTAPLDSGLPDKAPISASRHVADAQQAPVDAPDTTTAASTRVRKRATDQEAAEGAEARRSVNTWSMRGRVRFTGEEEFSARQLAPPARWHLFLIWTGSDNREEIVFCEFDSEWRFVVGLVRAAWPLEDAASGDWQLELHHSDAKYGPQTLKPKVLGDVLDFGDIVVDLKEVLAEALVLTGRIVHASGHVMSHCVTASLTVFLPDPQAGPYSIELTTDAAGVFVAVVGGLSDPSELLACRMAIHHGQLGPREVEGLIELGELARINVLDAPRLSGNLADFGTITLGGSVIEIEVEIQDDGRPANPGSELYVSFYSGEDWVDVSLPGEPVTTMAWVFGSHYRYDAGLSRLPAFYRDIEGEVFVAEGAVSRMNLVFSALKVIPLVVTTADTSVIPPDATVQWELKGEAGTEGAGSFRLADGLGVPVEAGLTTRLVVGVVGYAPAKTSATADDEKVLVTIYPLRPQVGRLKVTIAPWPDAVADIHALKAEVFVAGPEGAVEIPTQAIQTGRDEYEFSIPQAGEYRVYLFGGVRFGVRDGLLAGPVVVAVAAGETAFVQLPSIVGLPWDVPVNQVLLFARCGGRAVELSGPFRFALLSLTQHVTVPTGGVTVSGAVPVAFLGDGDEAPLELTRELVTETIAVEVDGVTQTGEHSSEFGMVILDLEPRISVTVKRNGLPVADFTVRWHGNDGSCEVSSTDGVARLWAPAGVREIVVRTDSGGQRLEVVVTPGTITEINLELEVALIELVVAKDRLHEAAAKVYNTPPAWHVIRVDERSETVTHQLQATRTLSLVPGRYKLVAGYGEPRQKLEFEFTAGEVRSVTLPALPLYGVGEVRLQFDHSLTPGVMSFQVMANEQVAETGLPWLDGWLYLRAQRVPEGLLISGIPVGTRCTMFVEMYGRDDVTYMTEAVTVTAAKEPQSVAVAVKRAQILHRDWRGVGAWVREKRNGGYWSFDYYVPAGQHELCFIKEGKIVRKETVLVPDSPDEEFEIPYSLREWLIDQGMLKPAD